jgi:hypothetical protein
VFGPSDEARKHLDQANKLTEATLDEHQEHRSVPWNRRLTLRLLRSEAETLLEVVTGEYEKSAAHESAAQPIEEPVSFRIKYHQR